MSDSSRLPARPSLEQLQKQAKELLRLLKAGDPAAAERFRIADSKAETLAVAQFVLSREHGFESWAKLKHYIEAVLSPELEKFERLAQTVATAYSQGDAMAIRELNWSSGTWFLWDHEPERMQQRLVSWYASTSRAPELALADARKIIARIYGFAGAAHLTTLPRLREVKFDGMPAVTRQVEDLFPPGVQVGWSG